jgi:hypothetical protein
MKRIGQIIADMLARLGGLRLQPAPVPVPVRVPVRRTR